MSLGRAAEIFAPFDPKFEDPKADPEQPGDRAALDQTAGIVRLDERETRAEDETASQQDHGVDRSDREIGLPRARIESRLIPMAGIALAVGGKTGKFAVLPFR